MINSENHISKSAFSKESFLCLKGYLALCVLIHHLYQFTGFLSDTSFGIVFSLLGHWAVVMFIFMSGYGLSTSYLANRETYLKTFPRRRLLPFYLTYLFFAVIYVVFELLNGSEITPSIIIKTLTYGGTVISFGWYFQLTLLLYIAFFVTRFIKKDAVFLTVLTVVIVVFASYKFIIGESMNVYLPAVSFLAGVIFAHVKGNLKSLEKIKPVIFLVTGLILFGLGTVAGVLIEYGYIGFSRSYRIVDLIPLGFMIIADLGLILAVMSLVTVICRYVPKVIYNPVSRFLGVNCLEIYALQGLFLRLLYQIIPIKILYALVAAACIIGVAVPAHMLIGKIMKRIKG